MAATVSKRSCTCICLVPQGHSPPQYSAVMPITPPPNPPHKTLDSSCSKFCKKCCTAGVFPQTPWDLALMPKTTPQNPLHKTLDSSCPKFCRKCCTVPRHDSDQGWACKECFSCGNQSFCQFPD